MSVLPEFEYFWMPKKIFQRSNASGWEIKLWNATGTRWVKILSNCSIFWGALKFHISLRSSREPSLIIISKNVSHLHLGNLWSVWVVHFQQKNISFLIWNAKKSFLFHHRTIYNPYERGLCNLKSHQTRISFVSQAKPNTIILHFNECVCAMSCYRK